jgi:hypothetical protein
MDASLLMPPEYELERRLGKTVENVEYRAARIAEYDLRAGLHDGIH